MRIDVTIADGRATVGLADPENFREFAVTAPRELDPELLSTAVARIGRAEGEEHVYVAPAALRDLAGSLAEDPEWTTSLAAMIAYADSKGWVDSAGLVRAHIEYV